MHKVRDVYKITIMLNKIQIICLYKFDLSYEHNIV